jgi:Fe2+ transport system protein FeoA
MGLSVGDNITVLNNSGPFIIANGDNRIVIGKGLAKKILITTG